MSDLSLTSQLEHRQQDEVESIKSIYGDIFKDVVPNGTRMVWNRKPPPHFEIFLESNEDPSCPIVSVTLNIEFTQTYPLSPPIVRITNPKNLLRNRVTALQDKVKELILEYPEEEVSFIIISEVKIMLDEFQLVTETVLSLEEERALRIKRERVELEAREAKHKLEREVADRKQNKELNEQIRKIKGETSSFASSTNAEVELADLVPEFPEGYFVFDNPITAHMPGTRNKFTFKAILGFIKYQKRDLLSLVGSQYIVKPYLSRKVQSKSPTLDISYLLTEIDFINPYWCCDSGTREIQSLERELQLVISIDSVNVNKLYGFQIDKNPEGWKVRLLTEFSLTSESLQDILPTAQFINWAIARNWLIQILEGIESLHNAGLLHKLICPPNVLLYESSLDLVDPDPTAKQVKLAHPSYGYRLLNMMKLYPNSGGFSTGHFSKAFTPDNWIAPEVKMSDDFNNKTDIWDLGVLFIRVMLDYNAIFDTYRTPKQFFDNFDSYQYQGAEEYALLVHEMLCKMLQMKYSKRPSPLELNAVKFFREGPVVLAPKRTGESFDYVSVLPEIDSRALRGNDQTVNPRPRRFSNQNQYLGEIPTTTRNMGRYERDFEEVGRLGKGGFGEVVKARNRMEGTYYAVKKIKHKADKLDSLLSEVLSLARLNHQYIVRYYGTWVEEVASTPAIDSETDDDDDDFELVPSISAFPRVNSFQVDYVSKTSNLDFSESLDGIVFGYSDDLEQAVEEESTDADESDESDSEGASELVAPRRQSKPQGSSILYIQMEFCENNTLLNLIEQGLPGNPKEYWRLFRQILEAVSYIHNEGFIHRDLKPMNIFIDKSVNVKVGDFGLAKNSHFSSVLLDNNQVNASGKDFSTAVGTAIYTAKEVATGEYDEKVDMYSLGIIFFEMCHTLYTGSERIYTLNELRLQSITFPSGFGDARAEKKIIQSLLDHDPKKRPTAKELLESRLLPLEHQEMVIQKALESLANPASRWQEQVRDTLFNQQYNLANDSLFDTYRNVNSHHLDYSIHDYLLFGKMIQQVFKIFTNHGAIEDMNSNILLPKGPTLTSESYQVLDKRGSVLTLPYDLILPTARLLSRSNVTVPKIFRHEYVYRPNRRATGAPDKYSTISFDLTGHIPLDKLSQDAECIKVVDEILQTFPCFKPKLSQSFIMINHFDILNSIISHVFRASEVDEKSRFEIMEILSLLGIDKSNNEIEAILRKIGVPHTIIKELITVFGFNSEPEKARQKLQKLMVDSPHLIKIENAFNHILNVLTILKQMGIQTPILFSPLSSYNAKYYIHGVMFQAVCKFEKGRQITRIATGGRYDSLITAFSNRGVNEDTPYAVGFSLATTAMFKLMKNLLERKKASELQKWRGIRCDILVTSTNECTLKESGHHLLRQCWSHNISCDLMTTTTLEEANQNAQISGANWIVVIKQPHTAVGKKKKVFKPLKVKNVSTGRDTDLEYETLLDYLRTEIDERNAEYESSCVSTTISEDAEQDAELTEISVDELSPLYTVDIAQKVVVVPNEAPRGRKNKKDKWEFENDSKIALAEFVKTLANCTVMSIDVNEEVLDVIAVASIHQQEEWLKKVFLAANNIPKSFATNIHSMLMKEYAKGNKWVILNSPKCKKTSIVDLER